MPLQEQGTTHVRHNPRLARRFSSARHIHSLHGKACLEPSRRLRSDWMASVLIFHKHLLVHILSSHLSIIVMFLCLEICPLAADELYHPSKLHAWTIQFKLERPRQVEHSTRQKARRTAVLPENVYHLRRQHTGRAKRRFSYLPMDRSSPQMLESEKQLHAWESPFPGDRQETSTCV